MSEKLTTKERLFVEAYLADPNGVQAAKKAGYKGTDKALSVVATRKLAKASIATLLNKRVESFAVTADQVLTELSGIALGDYRAYRADKVKSLELLGKHFKLFTDRTELNVNVSELTDEQLDAVLSAKG